MRRRWRPDAGRGRAPPGCGHGLEQRHPRDDAGEPPVERDDRERQRGLRRRGEEVGEEGVLRDGDDLAAGHLAQRATPAAHRRGDVLVPDDAVQPAVVTDHVGGGRLRLAHLPQGDVRTGGRPDDRGGSHHDRRRGEDPRAVDGGHELRDEIVGGSGEDLLGRADLDDPAVAHHRDAVAEVHGLVQVVRDEDDGLAERLLELEQLVLHLPADERVERGERLVHQQHVRVGRERPGEADALAHPARELRGQRVLPAVEPGECDRLARTSAALGATDALDLERERGVVDHRAVRQQGEVLEHHAHPAATELAQLLRADGRQVVVAEQDPAGRRPPQTVEHADERRLPRARQAHDDERLTARDLEARVHHRCRPERPYLLAGRTLLEPAHRLLGSPAEHLEHAVGAHCSHIHLVRRSVPEPRRRRAPGRAAHGRTVRWGLGREVRRRASRAMGGAAGARPCRPLGDQVGTHPAPGDRTMRTTGHPNGGGRRGDRRPGDAMTCTFADLE